jgi:hypothetical protein
MKTILRLLVAAVLANLTWHGWLLSSAYYKFRDALQSASQNSYGRSDDVLRGRVMELAAQYGIPLSEENFTLRRDVKQVFIDGSYVQQVDAFPGASFPWTFEFHIDSSYGNPLTMKDVGKDIIPARPQRKLPQ